MPLINNFFNDDGSQRRGLFCAFDVRTAAERNQLRDMAFKRAAELLREAQALAEGARDPDGAAACIILEQYLQQSSP